ncbi:YwiB family protein [Clostridium sp. JNZ X4-2]
MKKKAVISVSSKQSGDDEVIEVVTPGDFYKKNDSYYAVYKETQLSGMEGTTTTLKIKNNKFSLIRMGSTNANMDFNKNQKSMSMYKTPYGIIELKIRTNEMDININEYGGDVIIDYSMSLAGQATQDTQLRINIKTQE